MVFSTPSILRKVLSEEEAIGVLRLLALPVALLYVKTLRYNKASAALVPDVAPKPPSEERLRQLLYALNVDSEYVANTIHERIAPIYVPAGTRLHYAREPVWRAAIVSQGEVTKDGQLTPAPCWMGLKEVIAVLPTYSHSYTAQTDLLMWAIPLRFLRKVLAVHAMIQIQSRISHTTAETEKIMQVGGHTTNHDIRRKIALMFPVVSVVGLHESVVMFFKTFMAHGVSSCSIAEGEFLQVRGEPAKLTVVTSGEVVMFENDDDVESEDEVEEEPPAASGVVPKKIDAPWENYTIGGSFAGSLPLLQTNDDAALPKGVFRKRVFKAPCVVGRECGLLRASKFHCIAGTNVEGYQCDTSFFINVICCKPQFHSYSIHYLKQLVCRMAARLSTVALLEAFNLRFPRRFAPMSFTNLQMLLDSTKAEYYFPQETIVEREDFCDGFFILQRGAVSVYTTIGDRTATTERKKHPQFTTFGLSQELLHIDGTWGFCIEAETEVVVYKVPKSVFAAFLRLQSEAVCEVFNKMPPAKVIPPTPKVPLTPVRESVTKMETASAPSTPSPRNTPALDKPAMPFPRGNRRTPLMPPPPPPPPNTRSTEVREPFVTRLVVAPDGWFVKGGDRVAVEQPFASHHSGLGVRKERVERPAHTELVLSEAVASAEPSTRSFSANESPFLRKMKRASRRKASTIVSRGQELFVISPPSAKTTPQSVHSKKRPRKKCYRACPPQEAKVRVVAKHFTQLVRQITPPRVVSQDVALPPLPPSRPEHYTLTCRKPEHLKEEQQQQSRDRAAAAAGKAKKVPKQTLIPNPMPVCDTTSYVMKDIAERSGETVSLPLLKVASRLQEGVRPKADGDTPMWFKQVQASESRHTARLTHTGGVQVQGAAAHVVHAESSNATLQSCRAKEPKVQPPTGACVLPYFASSRTHCRREVAGVKSLVSSVG